MKKAAVVTLFTLLVAIPLLAENEERHQSYVSYDDGGTIVRSGEDGSEIEAHRNLPVYPGDEIVTARRGRAEVRLSDGNIIGVDRATALRFRSILDSYEGESGETVVELKYGKVAIHRTDLGRDHVRLDTDSASYVASDEAVYSVESDSRGRDRVTVFDGELEVRTQRRARRLREGESITVDDEGTFELTGDHRNAADDFEKWFLSRAERFGSYDSRHLDRRLSYWSDDLDDHGRWVHVTGIGYSWRPFVAAGWRPFYNGYWSNRFGALTWISYDPWGWGTYHYGRWAFDPGFGWVWVPGSGYSPAWVYWMYGSGTVGWAPAGWWDCHRPYYSWAYTPYRNHLDYGFGFYGRVRISDLDYRPWTFIDSRTIISNRVDRAALTTDAVKQRLGRSRDGFTTVAGGAARFTREEWNDPAGVIKRRGIGGAPTGRETGAQGTDLTPFFRRDGDVAGDVRDRIVRTRGTARGLAPSGTPSRNAGGGSSSSVAPISGGSLAPIGRGSVAPIGGGRSSNPSGRVSRGAVAPPAVQPAEPDTTTRSGRGVDRSRDSGSSGDTPRSAPVWRERGRSGPESPGPAVVAPADSSERPRRNDSWRRRVRSDGPASAGPAEPASSTVAPAPSTSGSDVPRRVIDRINGPRIHREPRQSGGSDRDSGARDSGSRDGGSRDRGSRDRSSRDSGSRDSGSRDSGSSARSSDSSGSSRSAAPPPQPRPETPSNDDGGRVKRDNQ